MSSFPLYNFKSHLPHIVRMMSKTVNCAYIYIGGVLKGTSTIITGENTIDISEYIGEGTNEVKLTCMDIYSNSKSLSYTVNAISLSI